LEPNYLTIYVDLDGVLFDYDTAANKVLKTDNHYKYEFIWGADKYWQRLHEKKDFFETLPLMPGAGRLWSAVKPYGAKILTALPKSNPDPVDRQKRQAVKDKIDWRAEVITCSTLEKPNFCKPGDILIDDRAVNRDAWIAKGGIYIIHTDADQTIGTLRALGVID
jgi:hypothetical protein